MRPADEEAWANAKLIELETHETFSTMEHEVRRLSDGTDMWIFPQCSGGKARCRSTATAISGPVATTAVGGTTCEMDDPRCCYHQFIVSEGVIKSYRARSRQPYTCRSNCLTRPASAREACAHELRR